MKQHRLSEAEEAFRSTLRLDPNLGVAHQALGEVFLREGNAEDAKNEFISALQLNPDSSEVRVKFAGLLIEETQYTEALWQLLEVLRLDPKNVPAIGALSFVFDRLGDNAGAVSWLKIAIQAVPHSADLYMFLGSHQYQEGQYADACASYQRAVQFSPRSGGAHYGLGLALLKKNSSNNSTAGREEFRTALRFNPRNGRAYVQLGTLALHENHLDAAAAYLRRAGRLEPSLADAPAQLGKVYQAQKKLGDAEAAFRAAIRLDPRMVEALYGLAQVLVARGLKDEAKPYFEQVRQLQETVGLQAQALVMNATGLQALNGGRLEDAVNGFRKALSLDPNPQSAYDLGSALVKQGKTQEAIEYFKTATRMRPSFLSAQRELAQALRKVGDPSADDEWQKAELLEALFAQHRQGGSPSGTAAIKQYNAGVSQMQEKRIPEAVEAFRAAIKLDQGFTQAHYALGVLLMRLGDKAGAKQEFYTVVRLNPENPDAHNNLGALLAQEQNYPEAVGQLLEVLHLNPKDERGRINLSNVFIAEGDIESATNELREAIRLMPDNGVLWAYLGRAQFRGNQNPAAILSFRKALELDPRLAPAHSGLGEALLERGQDSEASAELNSALRLDPNNPDAHFHLAKIALHEGNFEQASVHFEDAVRLNPRNVEALVGLGNAYTELKRDAMAEKEFRAALAVNPDMPQALYGLARLMNETGRAGEAKPYFERFEELQHKVMEKDLVPKLNAEGNELRKAGHLDAAAESYKKALAIDPSSYQVAYNLGLTLSGQGKMYEAIRNFRLAVRLRPSSVLAQGALVLALERVGDTSAAEERRKEELLKSFVRPAIDPGNPDQHMLLPDD